MGVLLSGMLWKLHDVYGNFEDEIREAVEGYQARAQEKAYEELME